MKKEDEYLSTLFIGYAQNSSQSNIDSGVIYRKKGTRMKPMDRVVLLLSSVVLVIGGCDSTGTGSGGGHGGSGGDFDATGAWIGSYTSEVIGTRSFEADIVQNGDTLGGSISIPLLDMDDATLIGTISDRTITFGDIDGVVSFTGTVADDEIGEGAYTATYNGDVYTGPWEATCIHELVLVSTIALPDSLSMSSYRGVAWDGTGFWVSDGQSLIKVDTDGDVIVDYRYNNDFEGGGFAYHNFNCLSWDGTYLWAVEPDGGEDWDEAWFHVIDPATGSIVDQVPCPPDGSSPSSGYVDIAPAWDGSTLWALRESWSEDQVIYEVDPETGEPLATIRVPDDPLNNDTGTPSAGGFGVVGSEFYYADRQGYIYRLDKSDGRTMYRYTFSRWNGESAEWSGEPGCITWDGSLLWVRDTFDQVLYGFDVSQ